MGEEKTKDDSSLEGDPKSVTESQQHEVYPIPPPYQGYPPPYDPGYQYGSPPRGYYPTTMHNFVLVGPPQRSPCYKFSRVFLTVMMIIFFGMSVMRLLTWLIYGSDIPVFYAQTLDMTVFSVDSMGINATWSANVSVSNPSHKHEVEYDYVEAALVYEDHLLDTNYVNPFELGKTERQSINFMFRMPNAQQKNILGATPTWEKDIENERRERGSVVFHMRIILNAVFTRDDHHKTRRTLRILCGDLQVVFPSPEDTAGKLNDKYKDCIIFGN